MREPSSFSVVIPSLNQADFLEDAIASILRQEYSDVEVLVVDGGSTDGTKRILESWGSRIRWISEPDEGQSHAIEKGIAMTKAPWCTWLNADDVQLGRALFRVDEAIRSEPSAEVVVGRGCYLDGGGGRTGPYPTIQIGGGADVRRELFQKGYVAQPSVYFRRDAYQRAGAIDRGVMYAMDYDLWVRLANSGARFVFVDEEISGNRWHGKTKTSTAMLDLLSEVVRIQLREFGIVSAYFVQAISDNLYNLIHSRARGDRRHLLVRWVYFKIVWAWLNYHRPSYLLRGLLMESFAMSGPVVGDTFGLREFGRYASGGLARALGRAWKR